MRLAIEAISVPKPPIFTPTSSAGQSVVNPEMRIAAGTFEIAWLATAPTNKARPSTSAATASRTASMRAALPTNIKNATNVSSNA